MTPTKLDNSDMQFDQVMPPCQHNLVDEVSWNVKYSIFYLSIWGHWQGDDSQACGPVNTIVILCHLH